MRHKRDTSAVFLLTSSEVREPLAQLRVVSRVLWLTSSDVKELLALVRLVSDVSPVMLRDVRWQLLQEREVRLPLRSVLLLEHDQKVMLLLPARMDANTFTPSAKGPCGVPPLTCHAQ